MITIILFLPKIAVDPLKIRRKRPPVRFVIMFQLLLLGASLNIFRNVTIDLLQAEYSEVKNEKKGVLKKHAVNRARKQGENK